MSKRPGFDAIQAEIAASGGALGGAWGPIDMGTYTPALCQWLVAAFPIRSVLDVGCGFGAHLRLFRSLGCNVIGVEGLHYAAKRCDVPVIVHDLEKGGLHLEGIDLAFSVEAAEHVGNVTAFLRTMCSGKIICMSAAPPGHEGHHHVTLKPPEWWINCLESLGYTWFPKLSELARNLGGGYFGLSGLVFVRDEYINAFGLDVGGYDP